MRWFGREKTCSLKRFEEGEIRFIRYVLSERPDEKTKEVLEHVEKRRLTGEDIALIIRRIEAVRPVDARGRVDEPDEQRRLLNEINACNRMIKKLKDLLR